MPTPFEAKWLGAAALVVGLGLALLVALAPYDTGLIGIPVLYVTLAPVHRWLARRLTATVAAGIIVGLAVFLLLVLGGAFTSMIVAEAQRIAGNVPQSPILTRLSELKVAGVDLGARLADLEAKLMSWIGTSAFGLIGSASRFALNLAISFVGVFYLLLRPQETWDAVRPFILFSARNTDKLRQRFREMTISTLLGTGLSAVAHGVFIGLGFWVVGLPNAALWGVVTMVFAILPILGSGLVWGPGAIALLLDHRPGAAILLALWGLFVVGNTSSARWCPGAGRTSTHS